MYKMKKSKIEWTEQITKGKIWHQLPEVSDTMTWSHRITIFYFAAFFVPALADWANVVRTFGAFFLMVNV